MSFLDELFGASPPPTTPSASKTAPTPSTVPIKTLAPQQPVALASPVPAPRIYNDEVWRQSLFNQETGFNKTAQQRNTAVGDFGKAVGPFQQWPVNVENANEVALKLQRIEVQKWAKDNKVAIGSKKYNEKLDSIVKPYRYTLEDRKDPIKAEAIFQLNMNDLHNQFVEKYKREPTPIEMAGLHNAGTLAGLKANKRTPVYMAEFAEKYAKATKEAQSKKGK